MRARCALVVLLCAITPARGGDVHVAVAANFLATLQTLAQRFEAETGDRVLISSGSTGKLYAQIHQGAPFQVFLAADSEHPRILEQEGVAAPGSRFTYALGKLVLWSRDPATIDQSGAALRQGRIRRLAIANPKTAPYGRAAQQTLAALGLWQDWETRVVRGENVGQTLQYAATGNVDAAFVALAQIRQLSDRQTGATWVVPDRLYQPIEQQAVLLSAAGEHEAPRRFLRYLRSPVASRFIEASGYGISSTR